MVDIWRNKYLMSSLLNVNCVLVKYHVGFAEGNIILPIVRGPSTINAQPTTNWVLTNKSWIVPHAR